MIKLAYKTVIPTRVTLTLNPPLHAHVSTTGLFMTTDLRTAKKDLRKTIRAKLSHLPGESIAAQCLGSLRRCIESPTDIRSSCCGDQTCA